MNFNFSHPALKKIGRIMLAGVFGASIYQINILVGTLLASLLEGGSVSYLYYAGRFFELPQGVFVISIATVVLPAMSRFTALGDMEGLKDSINFALRLIFFISMPAMVGIIVLSKPIVMVIFQRGQFDYNSTILTAEALIYYTLGLWSVGGYRIVLQGFYSLKDTKTPVKIALYAFFINLIFSLLLMGPMKHSGLAFANTISSVFNFIFLIYLLRERIGALGLRNIVSSVLKSSFASAIMGILIFLVRIKGFGEITASVNGALKLAAIVLIGLSTFLICSFLIKSQELKALLNMMRQRE